MKGKGTQVLGIVGMATMLAGAACGAASSTATSSSSAATSSASQKHYSIDFITPGNTNPYFITMDLGAEEEAQTLGDATVTWDSAPTTDLQAQVQVLNAAMVTPPDFLIIAPASSTAMNANLAQVKSDGVPIITVDRDVTDTSVRIGSIYTNNTAAGAKAADLLVPAMGGTGDVAYEGYTPGAASVDDRHQGFENEMLKYPQITNDGSEYDPNDIGTAESNVAAEIQRDPNLRGIFASSEDPEDGAAAAIEAAGMVGKIKLVGFDSSSDVMTLLREGVITDLVVQKALIMGQLAVKDAIAYLTHHVKPPSVTLESYILVNQQNMNDPSIEQYIYRS